MFGMGTGGTPTLKSPKSHDGWALRPSIEPLNLEILHIDGQPRLHCAFSKFYGQAERAISSSQLNVLLRLHICPINVVVFHGPS